LNLLEEVFLEKKVKFIPYISLGDPEYALSVEWAKSLIQGGADILELGIPFSDPVADGPVIQKSYYRSLQKGFSMKKILDTTKSIHHYKKKIPLIYLTSFNPILAYGIEKFFHDAKNSGICGAVIPDLPFDSKDFSLTQKEAQKNEISLIQMITPATPKDRIMKLKKIVNGFVYYVTSYGVTGERKSFDKDLEKRIKEIKKSLSIPVCAGFGISNSIQAKEISTYSDGIIIGSAIQRIIEENLGNVDLCAKKLYEYSKEISNSVHHS
jgi:tryptophan synthase alpha chain